MKILHFISSLKHGGAERLVVDLLPLLKKQGIEVCLVSMTEELALASFLEKQGIRVLTLQHRGTIYRADRMLQSIIKLKMILNRVKPDILHSHLYLPDLVARFAAPSRYRLITTLHNTDFWWIENHRLRSRLKTKLDSSLGKIRQVFYIAVSAAIKEVACKVLHIQENRIRMIYNGIDLQKFSPKGKTETDHSFVIIQVGRFDKQKGHLTSLKALQSVRSLYPNVKLLLVGEGPQRHFIEEVTKRMALTDAVEFLGVCDDVPLIMHQSTICWMPSEWEGLGIACIEAMACGLPVVASSVGGLTEVVSDNTTGYLIPNGSFEQLAKKTIKIFADSGLAAQMSLAGRRRVEQKFSLEDTAARYVEAYKDIIEGRW